MDTMRFTFLEMLSLIGVVQCVYVLVYVSFRAGDFFRVLLPLLYFFVLGAAFFIDFGRGFISELTPYYDVLSWGAWSVGIPVSVLLILQMAHIERMPSLVNWGVLLLVPFAYLFSRSVVVFSYLDCVADIACPELMDWLSISGGVTGAISLLVIWMHRNLFSDISHQKAGKERYWLIVSIIIVNIVFLALAVFSASNREFDGSAALARTIMGLSFVYLVSTSLFRIYPSALFVGRSVKESNDLNIIEREVAEKIENLLAREKIYHEANYSRSDLARELSVSEGVISRVINVHFQKSFPQLLNEHRIHDAQRLLLETDVSVRIVSDEVGFNSLPSFNRVFKEMVGQSPSEYRKNTIK